MAETSKPREAHFPAIEKKYGQPMSYWHGVMAEIADRKYAEQIAYLKENHGFGQTHANALVMYSRGSTSARRFNTLDEYLKEHDATKRRTVKAIIAALRKEYPQLELVIAWNQPMLKIGKQYVFGVMVASTYILIAPFDATVLAKLGKQLTGYTVNKKTVQVPADWQVDATLLKAMVQPAIERSGQTVGNS